MNTTNKVLMGLLAGQVALAALTWASAGSEPSDDRQPLVDAKLESISQVTITGKPAKAGEAAASVSLTRKGEGWVVTSADDYPADKKKVDEVLDRILDARIGAAVASQKANHNALDVGEREYARKLKLVVGDQTTELVIGNAKGSSVHARRAGDDAVYVARGFAAQALADQVRSYVDTHYVQLDEPTEVQVTGPQRSITVVKNDRGGWAVNELPSDAPVDQSKARAFVSSARQVQLSEPVGRTVEPSYGLGDEATVVTVRKEDAETVYRIGKAVGDAYYVKADTNDYVVKVSKYAVETLVKQTPDQFIQEPEAPSGGMPGGMPGGGMPPGMMPPGMMPQGRPPGSMSP